MLMKKSGNHSVFTKNAVHCALSIVSCLDVNVIDTLQDILTFIRFLVMCVCVYANDIVFYLPSYTKYLYVC